MTAAVKCVPRFRVYVQMEQQLQPVVTRRLESGKELLFNASGKLRSRGSSTDPDSMLATMRLKVSHGFAVCPWG